MNEEQVKLIAKYAWENSVEPRVKRTGDVEHDDHLATVESTIQAVAELIHGSYWDERRTDLAKPYSKPMHPEHWAELDGIEALAKWLKGEGGAA